jgi:Tic22-like family
MQNFRTHVVLGEDMKSLIRWGAALSLIGGILINPLSIGSDMRALALTNEQVVERLQSTPVFTFLDNERNFLVTRPANATAETLPVVYMFISQQAAQTFLNELKQKNPQQANGFQVTPVPLSVAYQMARRDQNQENPVQVAFISIPQQVEAARTLIRQAGGNPEQFEGVPLFIVKSSADEGSYLTRRVNNQEIIPFYFSREDAQAMIDQLRQSQPDLAGKVEIQVISLEGLIQNLQSSDNAALNQIFLIPTQETITFIRSLQPAAGQAPAAGQRPAAGQAPAAGQRPAQTQQQNPNRRNRNNPAPAATPAAPARPQQ